MNQSVAKSFIEQNFANITLDYLLDGTMPESQLAELIALSFRLTS